MVKVRITSTETGRILFEGTKEAAIAFIKDKFKPEHQQKYLDEIGGKIK